MRPADRVGSFYAGKPQRGGDAFLESRRNLSPPALETAA